MVIGLGREYLVFVGSKTKHGGIAKSFGLMAAINEVLELGKGKDKGKVVSVFN
jgi:hypothetical protein